jgi:hypothetical protein
MDNKKVKVTVVVKCVSDQQDKELANNNGDGYLVLKHLQRLMGKMSEKNDDEDTDNVLRVLDAELLSSEVMASALADVGRDDLFDEKVQTVKAIDAIVKQIKNNL